MNIISTEELAGHVNRTTEDVKYGLSVLMQKYSIERFKKEAIFIFQITEGHHLTEHEIPVFSVLLNVRLRNPTRFESTKTYIVNAQFRADDISKNSVWDATPYLFDVKFFRKECLRNF